MAGLVFDLGGTHLRSAIVDDRGELHNAEKIRILTIADGLKPEEVWTNISARLAGYIKMNVGLTRPGSPIVLSFPGPVDERGRILQAPTLTGKLQAFPDLRAELEATGGRPVHVLNDLSAAALYLSRSTPGRFLAVTVSSGIGSKIFDPAVGVLDDAAYAGEIGHGRADFSPAATICDCGGRGHLGAIASGRAIERHARASASSAPERFERSACALRYAATADTLNNEDHLVPALRAGDPWTVTIVAECTQYLARAVVSAILVAGIGTVIVIGGFALAAGEAYLNILRAAARQCCDYDLLRDRIENCIVLGAVHEEAALLGAATYVERAARR